MRYSVWNQAASAFDYYESSEGNGRANAPKPDHLRARTLGLTVEQAAWPLPAGAQYVGSGPFASGRLAIAKSAALGDDAAGGLSTAKGALLFVAGVLGIHFLLPKRSRRSR